MTRLGVPLGMRVRRARCCRGLLWGTVNSGYQRNVEDPTALLGEKYGAMF